MITKNNNAKEINRCGQCEHLYHFMFVDFCTAKAPDEKSRKIKNRCTIPKWCPLKYYKE